MGFFTPFFDAVREERPPPPRETDPFARADAVAAAAAGVAPLFTDTADQDDDPYSACAREILQYK